MRQIRVLSVKMLWSKFPTLYLIFSIPHHHLRYKILNAKIFQNFKNDLFKSSLLSVSPKIPNCKSSISIPTPQSQIQGFHLCFPMFVSFFICPTFHICSGFSIYPSFPLCSNFPMSSSSLMCPTFHICSSFPIYPSFPV